MGYFEPLAPACMKCEQVTGKSTCFPGPCRFYHERSQEGTTAYNVARLDRIRRGMLDPIRASTPTTKPRSAE